MISGVEVASLGPSGVVVSNTNGEVITHQIPAAPSVISVTTPTQVLGVVAGHTIFGSAVGSTAVALGGQTLSLGGGAVTLSGNQAATLGSSGLVTAAPGGFETTMAITTGPVLGIVAGHIISGSPVGSLAAVVNGQTLTLGGAAVTLSGN